MQQPPDAGEPGGSAGTSGLEQQAIEVGRQLEDAGRELGRKLDEKLSQSQTGREIKETARSWWKKIQDTIQ